MASKAIVPGSIESLAQQNGTSIAESFLTADAIVIVDVSGSMDTPDSRGGRRRYDVACEELAKLQASMPGRVAVVAFSSSVEFVPGGVPPFFGTGTDLAAALTFVKVADECVQFIVISDGQPDNEQEALKIAKSFKSKINTVYVGPESDRHSADFLRRLANASGGVYTIAEKAQELSTKVQAFLLSA